MDFRYGITTGSPRGSRIFSPGSVRTASDPNRRADSAPGLRRFIHLGAARSGRSRAASPRRRRRGRNLVVDVRCQRLLRLQLSAAEVRGFLRLGVAELVHARRQSRGRGRTADGRGHAVAGAVHDEGARIASALPDWRELPADAERQLPASPRSAHGAGRDLPPRASARALRLRRGPRRVADPRPDAVHAPGIGAQQPGRCRSGITASTRRTSPRASSASASKPARCRSRPRRFAAPNRTKTG